MNSLLTLGKQSVSVVFVITSFFANSALAAGDVMVTLTNASEGIVVELTEEDLLAMDQSRPHQRTRGPN